MPPCRQYTGQVCRAIAIAYTVWAKKKGGGKHMVNEVYKMIKNSNHIDRLITLSPLTDMARKFHLEERSQGSASESDHTELRIRHRVR